MKIPLLGWAFFSIALAGSTFAQTTVDSPIFVPLHFQPTDTGSVKLGIYVGIGGGSPALFEFDTGGSGFYAAFSSDSHTAPWWGTYQDVNYPTAISTTYDSGLSYSGYLSSAAVSLHGSATSGALVTTSSTAQIGRMDLIQLENPSTGAVIDTLWSNDGSTSSSPPINGAFYGDFGMNLAHNKSPDSGGLSNLVAQLHYGSGVTAGFRIHADRTSGQAWLQIGLTTEDTNNSSALYFKMNPDPDAPPGSLTPVTGLPFYGQQLFNATITITDGENTLTSEGVGITPDTGASTTLHNTQLAPEPLPGQYDEFIDWNEGSTDQGDLMKDLSFALSGTTLSADEVSYFEFVTTHKNDDGKVMVQNNRPANSNYYLNTGISLFYSYDVIYNIEDGVLGLIAVPEPSTITLLAVGVVAGIFVLRRRHG